MTELTQLVYQRDGERLFYTAKVFSVVLVSHLPESDQALVKDTPEIEHAVITDSTIFHANSTFEVRSVRQPAQGNRILHFGRFFPADASAAAPTFDAGGELQQRVDAEKRNLRSRLHTAGHVMSLAIHAMCREGESKASHYPDSAAVVFVGALDGKHRDAIQAKTDEIHWWHMEELLARCHASEGFALPEGETVGRVVEREGLGSYPCSGTRVRDCSQVGKIEVKKISRSKGTSKASYRVA
ncbi:hypothetical protein CTA1_6086 [Colletotrichum tanaceti]|uniref:Alanyl-tRNA editing protein AlaX-L n=1 Tax=Colletotrichum tanaceti TaxID=1306861 RepID=A0A4U6XCV2_9PEZI|nr:hypothetical protein CTA1_6086 [Colletotrichum tanaceti]